MFREGESNPEYFFNPENIQLPETRMERLMENASRERFGMLAGHLVDSAKNLNRSKAFQKSINLAPFVGDFIMAGKAAIGREGEQTLSRKERFIYATAATSEFVSAALLYNGHYTEAGALHVISESISKADALATMGKSAAGKIIEKNPRLAHMLFATSEWIGEQKGKLANFKEIFASSVESLDTESAKADD